MTADDDLRWRLEVLKAQFEDGKIHVAEHLADDLRKSLAAIRYAPDGQIDTTTVDGRVRALSLAAAHLKEREETKNSISLREIQNIYFENISASFGDIYQEMKQQGLGLQRFSKAVSHSPSAVGELAPQIPKFMESLVEFWDTCSEPASYHLQDLQGLKGVFGGDLFPSPAKNIASTCGLYLDTIVLADPFINSKDLFTKWRRPKQVEYLLKHAMNVLSYKDLALADLEKPIVVIAPNRSSMDDDEREFLLRISETDALRHANALFSENFSAMEEFIEFSRKLDTPTKIVQAVRDKKRFLFDTEWVEPLEEQVARAARDQAEITGSDHPGETIVNQCFGRMRQATDILLKSRYLGGTPLIQAETSWRYFGWKLEYNAALSKDDLHPLHMVKGLQTAGLKEMEWLGDIPPEGLIEIRRSGALDEIRSILSAGVEEISSTNQTNFFRSGDRIIENIQNAFAKHRENIKELRGKEFRFVGKDLGSWLVAGSVEVAAIATGTPAFGVAAFALNQVVDAPKLREIPARFRTLRDARQKLKQSPMGLFFKHRPK